jgi:hypothetical protein
MAKTSKATAEEKIKSKQSGGQPLFFKNPQPVDAVRHANAGIQKDVGFAFARNTNSVPITIHEFVEVARSYPIVFTQEEIPMPLAVLGMKDKNPFVDSAGRWKSGHYVPGYVRKYPFALLEVPDRQQFVLCVDEGAPHFQADHPELPLYKGKEPAEVAQEAIELCRKYNGHYLGTQQFGSMLKNSALLEQKELHAEVPGKERYALGGFQLLSEEKWNSMPDKEFLQWRQRSWTGLITLAMASQVNWKYIGQMESA